MLTKTKTRVIGCGLVTVLTLGGCSGGDQPAPTASPSAPTAATATPGVAASATPAATTSPSDSKTPAPHISPLGGKPATEDEIQYHNLQKKGVDLALARNYKEAIPIFEQAMEQQPGDLKNVFYLLLSHGSLEPVPAKGSAAYPYAQKVVELAPRSSEAERARGYLAAAELNIPKDFKYGPHTMASLGGFLFEPDAKYKLVAPTKLHIELGPRLGKSAKSTLWEAEVAPKLSGNFIELKKGTEVTILSEAHYFYSLTGWRTPIKDEPEKYDASIFEVSAFYVEVTSDGDEKGKKGWLINQVDRFISNDRDDPWGVWIPNRLGLERQAP